MNQYTHSKKIGNKGDLIKHYALTSIIRDQEVLSDPYTYLDVHAGRSDYVLESNGEWRRGIGEFMKRCALNGRVDDGFEYYLKVNGIENINKNMVYFGSSKIIQNVLIDCDVKQINLYLCDISGDVCSDLRKGYHDTLGVHIFRSDGYEQAKKLQGVDLTFIDPPDISKKGHYYQFIDLVKYCISDNRKFVAWNPLHGDTSKGIIAKSCQSVIKLADKYQIPLVTVMWSKNWSGQMCGCQMLLSVKNGKKIVSSCESLARFMGWECI